jgi:hypothetical protein
MSMDAPHDAVEESAVEASVVEADTVEASTAAADAATAEAPGPVATPTPAATTTALADDDHEVAWWVPTWYVLFCALPLAGAFFLPVPLMMVMRSYRPPVGFTTAAWVGIIVGWVLWGMAIVAWLLAGWLFRGDERGAGSATWWRRTTQMWIVLVLTWGLIATVGIWVFYAVVGHALGLDTID